MRREDLAAYLKENKVRIWGIAAPTALTLRIEAKPETLEKGLRVARLLLTEPKIRQEDLEGWQARYTSRRGGMGGQRLQGRRLVSETVIDAMFAKGEARPRRASDESVQRLTTSAVQAWLDESLGVGGEVVGSRAGDKPVGRQGHPIEAAIAGDIPVAEAVRLGALYLGNLSERPRISAETYAGSRKAERSAQPLVGTREVVEWSGNAFIVGGFLGADLKNLRDYRALAVAAEIIDGRMQEWPQDDRGGEGRSGAGAQAVPGSAYPGFGLLVAATEVSPERADSVLVKMSELLDQLREKGPTSDEVEQARIKLAANARDMKSRAGYWSSILASNVYHDVSVEALSAAEAMYTTMTAEEVSRAIRAYDTPERRIRLKIVPGKSERAPAAGS